MKAIISLIIILFISQGTFGTEKIDEPHFRTTVKYQFPGTVFPPYKMEISCSSYGIDFTYSHAPETLLPAVGISLGIQNEFIDHDFFYPSESRSSLSLGTLLRWDFPRKSILSFNISLDGGLFLNNALGDPPSDEKGFYLTFLTGLNLNLPLGISIGFDGGLRLSNRLYFLKGLFLTFAF